MDARADVAAVSVRLSASPSGRVGEGDGTKSAASSTPTGVKSSPPMLASDVAMDLDAPNGNSEDPGVKSDSEAETIVLPGKDGHSPSKIRKSIKHEDRSEDEEMRITPDIGHGHKNGDRIRVVVKGDSDGERTAEKPGAANIATSNLGKRKRPKHGNGNGVHIDDSAHHGNSSGLSSVPTSPVATTRSSLSKQPVSDSDSSRSPSPRSVVRAKAKSVDRVLPRRKQYASGSGDEGESRRFNRQRSSGVDQKQSKEKSSKNVEATSRKRTRSISPPPRSHRRSISTQLLHTKSTHGLSHKKKRVPAPLQSTEYQSDESSASGSSHPRSSRRHLAAPTTGDSAISPAKMAPHKKHVNSSGQTLVARACQSGKLEIVKQRLDARPDDLNEVDFAENTPLHTASLAGFSDIVQYLLEAGCTVDPVNDARDTPLHDAIDNGHLDVVKLLLDAGANPRKANGKGEDPYDLVDDEGDEAIEIREAILAAKNKTNDRRSSEDEQMHDNADSRLSHPKGSPRQTPPIQSHEMLIGGYTSRRNATTRSIKTSDRVLYQPLNLSELRRAAGQNDTNTVVRILDVHNNNLDDPKSLIIAAKAGHHDVINMLFGYGQFNPDPESLDNQPPESATPILAAIGRDNLEVIELFLNQPNFDPTRRIGGETYFEIAKRRAGSVWKEEEALLKDAFDKYKKNHKSSPGKPRSPGLRRDGREADRDVKRVRRDEQPVRSHKRTPSSPKAREPEPIKAQRSNSSAVQSKEAQNSSKRGPGRPKKEDMSAVSDEETAPLGPPKQKSQARRSESEVAVASSDNEAAVKPRRKLVSGKEYRGERDLEKQRRTSVASTTSSASIKGSRDGESKSDKVARKTSPSVSRISSKNSNHEDLIGDKHPFDKEKARSLKRDDSKDRLSAIRGESPVKRPRKSETPPRSGMQEVATNYDAGGGPTKKRKIETESKKADSTSSSSPDHRTSVAKSASSHEKPGAKSSSDAKEKDKSARSHKRVDSPERSRNRLTGDDTEKKPGKTTSTSEAAKVMKKDPSAEDAAALAAKAEQEREVQRQREKEEQEAQRRREKEAREAKEKAELEEKLEAERIEQARLARLAREQTAREEELKRQQEENERRERQRIEDENAHAREQERQRILYLEQEKQRREDQERRRAQIQEQQRAERVRIEKEKRIERLAKLPLLLRWLDMEADPRTQQYASLFRFIEGFRYDTIKPEATGQPNGRESWMLNTHAALLLGEKDLQLSRYTAWERIPLSFAAKQAIWKIENGVYSLRHPNLADLRKRFDDGEPAYKVVEKCKPLFLDLDLFFVKISEFMFVVPNFPHLRGLEMVVKYRELEETPVWPPQPGKWTRDVDVDPNQKFAPRPRYFVNGNFVRQGETLRTKISTTSLGERRVPRRGLMQVFPGEPDYLALAKEQGLFWLLPEYQSRQQSRQPSGSSVNENAQINGHAHQVNGQVNGITPPGSDTSRSINGGSPHQGSVFEQLARPSPGLPNGTHETGVTLDTSA